jgi:hypothetical protein
MSVMTLAGEAHYFEETVNVRSRRRRRRRHAEHADTVTARSRGDDRA